MTLTPDGLQNARISKWTFADATARAALADPQAAEDVGKLAYQTDDGSYWVLTDNTPIAWTALGSGLPTLTGGGIIIGAPTTDTKVAGRTTGWTTNSGSVGGTFPLNIVDPDLGTGCQFDDVTGGVEIVYDAGAAIAVKGIRLAQDGPADPSGRNHIKVQSSTDNATWTDRYEWNGVDSSDTYYRRLTGDATITERYWKLIGVNETAAAWNIRFFDLVGPNANAGTPTALPPGGENQLLRIKPDGGGGFRPLWAD